MKPLVVFDLETTGLDRTKDQIIQFAAIKINRETNEILDSKNLYIQPEGNYQISIQAYMKHGIKADFLKDKPHFIDVAQEIFDFFNDCEILTYNGNNFDIPFLITEFDKVGITFNVLDRVCYDAFMEEKRRNGIGLENTYKRYKGKTMEESGLTAHDALSDVKATYAVFYAQQKVQPYEADKILTQDNFIVMKEFQGQEKPCFSFGKYKDLSVEFVSTFDKNYLEWCVGNTSNFLPTTKDYITKNFLG